MNLTLTPDGLLVFEKKLGTGDTARIKASEIRRERTGLHATVSVWANDTILAYDTFNVGRSEERGRLAKRAVALLPELVKLAWGAGPLTHDLDIFCAELGSAWEDRFQIETVDGSEPPPLTFAIDPYILNSGGTVFFSPPGAGKSYTLQIMATALMLPLNQQDKPMQEIWKVPEPRMALYVNLERSADSVRRRAAMIMRALGMPGKPSPVSWLNARGRSLKDVSGKVRRFVRETPNTTVFIDSLSRAGAGGSLNDDETGNLIADQLNNMGRSWAAIAHTPRATADHAYGTIMIDAAEDIGVKLSSERRENVLGIGLTVVKANDIAFPAPFYYALEFGENGQGLTAIRTAKATEFPELALGEKTSPIDRIITYLLMQGQATTTLISKDLGIETGNVSRYLANTTFFRAMPKQGRDVPYQLQESYLASRPRR